MLIFISRTSFFNAELNMASRGLLLVFCAFVIIDTAFAQLPHIKDKDSWMQKQQLKQNEFYMAWNYSSTHIIFRIYAFTTGWVGFGLSPNGGMAGSDVVIAWHLSGIGQTVFSDRFAQGRYTPKRDKSQDWHLISGREESGWSIFTFSRKSDTCDTEDLVIRPVETQRIIWAMSSDGRDPVSEPNYHRSRRGTLSTQLLSPPPAYQPLPNDAYSFEFRMNQFKIPANQETLWWCKTVPLPDVIKDQPYYAIQTEPYIEKGNEDIVHHMVIYGCYDSKYLEKRHHNREYECYNRSNSQEVQRYQADCNDALFAWAVGGVNFTFPGHVALPVTSPAGGKLTMFRLEMHYDNPNNAAGWLIYC